MKFAVAGVLFLVVGSTAHAEDGYDWGFDKEGRYVFCYGWKDVTGTHWCY